MINRNVISRRAWFNHFCLHLGGALRLLFFAVLPPEWTGLTPEGVEDFAEDNWRDNFKEGLFDQGACR